jgi:hypothetical protein
MLATQYPAPVPQPPAPNPLRTNSDLNLSVLRRHNPDITSVLSIAPYAVIYTFNTTSQSWEKSGIEGTLFICQLEPLYPEYNDLDLDYPPVVERYEVHVLNRRGLENFAIGLTTPDSIEVTEEYIIMQGDSSAIVPFPPAEDLLEEEEEHEAVIYGLWVFAEPAPSSTAIMRDVNARVIVDCAIRARDTRAAVEGELDADDERQHIGMEVLEDEEYLQEEQPNGHGHENQGEGLGYTRFEDSQHHQDAYDHMNGRAYDAGFYSGHQVTTAMPQPHYAAPIPTNGFSSDQQKQKQRLLGLFGASPSPATQQQQYQSPAQQQSMQHQGYGAFAQPQQYATNSHPLPRQQQQQEALLDLFTRARQGYGV